MKTTYFAILGALVWMAGSAAAQETTEPVATEQTQVTFVEAVAPAAPQLPLGAWVQLEITEALSSDNAVVGQLVALRVVEPISIDDTVVIPAGTTGVGEIIDVRERAMGGRPGRLVAASRYLDLNGQQIRLEGMIVGGTARGSVSGAAPFLGAASAFIPGAHFQVAAGTRVSARIAGGAPEVAAPIEGRNPVPSPPPGKALIVFYYIVEPGMPGFFTYGVAENGTTLVRFRGNRYLAVPVDPGTHDFEVLESMNRGRTGTYLRQEVFEGQTIFIRHDEFFLSTGSAEEFSRRRLRLADMPTAE